MQVHGALHARDNTSDVWRGLDQLAEQACYLVITPSSLDQLAQ